MKIHIESIPHELQRYPTCGDYWDEGDTTHIRVSQLSNWRYEVLIAVHELIEMVLTKHRGISEQVISDYDIQFEKLRELGRVAGEPGDSKDAPYKLEHFFATNVERLLAAELGVDWSEYDQLVNELGVKK